MTSPLADLLGKYLQITHTSVNRLSILSGVPQRTIANWLNGFVRKPHQWQPLIKVALTLHLAEEEANELLRSAGHPGLAELRSTTREPDHLALLDKFQSASFQSSPSPFQVIADLPTFVGRSTELEELKRAILDRGRATVYGLRGMGGVGKTSLAAHLAYQVRDQFPDGVLWARLDTSDSLSILEAFADAYGKDVSAYKDVESRASVVRNLLAEKRALIVLDNAETSAQIRVLLPPSTGKNAVLITTRRDLSVADGWTRITLEPFDTASDDALLLFERYLGGAFVQLHRALLSEIAALLGYLPLALAIAAGRLANEVSDSSENPNHQVHILKSLLNSLQASPTRLGILRRDDMGVRASFELSYVALMPFQQELFCTLGIFSGEDFGVDAVAYLTHQTPDQANAELRNLYLLSLVQESRGGRWRLHPLMQDYAREKLEVSGQMMPVVERTLRMYRQAVQNEWGFERSIDEEIPNMRFALEQASRLNLYQPLLETVLMIYPALSIGGWFSLARTVLQQVLPVAQGLGDVDTEIYLLNSLGYSQQELGESQSARENFRQALELAQSANRQQDMADIYMNMGKLEIELGYHKQARIYFEQSLALAKKINDQNIIGKVTNNIAMALTREARYSEAESMYLESLEIVRAHKDVSAILIALTNLGDVASLQNDWERADTYWKEGLSLARSSNVRVSIVMLLANSALACAERGEWADADRSFEEAIQIARDIHSHHWESAVRSEYGNILRRQGKLDEALGQLILAGNLARGAADMERNGINLRYLGQLFLDRGQLEEAGSALDDALAIAKDIEQDIMIADTYYLQAKVAFAGRRFSESRHLAGDAIAIYERMRLAQQLDEIKNWVESASDQHE